MRGKQKDSPRPLSFLTRLSSLQVTSAPLEAPAIVHAPASEPELQPVPPTDSLSRGIRTTQEPLPVSSQQSSRDSWDGDGVDLTATGRRASCVSPHGGLGLSQPMGCGSRG